MSDIINIQELNPDGDVICYIESTPDWTLRYDGDEPWDIIVNRFNALMENGEADAARELLEAEYAGGSESEAAGIKLAVYLRMGWFGYKELELAAGIFKKLAQKGNACAMCNLGDCYMRGDGVKQSKRWAFYWLRRAADNGDANAQLSLGVELIIGTYLAKDYEKAERLLDLSARQDEVEAIYNLGHLKDILKDYAAAAAYYRQAIDLGASPLAELHLSRLYRKGLGVEKDLTEAASLLKRALERGIIRGLISEKDWELMK